MATNKAFMTFGFLAVLLLSVGFAFANVDNFNLIIDGEGNSSDNRITAENGTTKTLSLVLNHDNTTFEKVQINWSGGRGFLILPENGLFSTGNHIFLLSIIMPDEVVDSTRILTATLYNSSNLTEELGEEKVTIFYNSTLPVVEEEEPTTESKFPICKKVGDLKISDFTVNNFGVGDDEEWEPLDELEIEVEIENRNKDDDVRDVLVQITILDSDNNDLDVTRDFDLENEEIDLGKINDDDDEIATFRIRELPGDIEDGNFKMVFHVFSEDNEANQCVSESTRFEGESIFYSEFEVVREDNDAVILKSPRNIEDIKILASCGEDSVEVSFKIYNVGVDKEKHTLVTLFNSVLGINERLVVDNLREGKNKKVTFFIDIPEDLSKTRYDLSIMTFFEYDDGDELEETSYDTDSDDLERGDFSMVLEILACNEPKPKVNANLDSSAVVGKELVIRALVTNEGSLDTFDFSLSGLGSWAELVSISPKSVDIDEGETIEVVITLLPTEAGSHTFDLNMIVNGEIFDQAIVVEIQGGDLESLGWNLKSNDKVLYLAGAIAILLILIFVTLLVRVSRRTEKTEF